MKLLWVKSGGLLPLDAGGKIRSFSIARELARRHEVTVFTFYPTLTPDPHQRLKEPFAHVECLPLNVTKPGSTGAMIEYAANALTTRPYQMRKYCRPEVGRRVRELLRNHTYDALVCDFLTTAGVIPWDVGIPIIIFTHNVEAVIWQRRFMVDPNLLWKLVAWREYRTTARVERYFTDLADHVLTVSEDDRKAFLRFLSDNKVTTIETGVDLDYFRPRQFTPSGHSLVFTGSMDWIPNEDAIIYFATEILPRINKRFPDATLCVAGKNPTRKLLALKERNPAIQVTGAVDDIRPYVSASDVYVVPLRIGGGTRIKIFEAMAMGIPVVSTSIGAEGLPVQHGRDIMLADTPAEFAERTIEFLEQPTARERFGRAARSLVESRYGWASVTDVFEQVLERVVRTPSLSFGDRDASRTM